MTSGRYCMLKLPLLVLVLVLGCVEVCCGASVKHNDTAVAEWLRQCPDPSSPCCRIWHRAVLKSEQARQSFLSSVLDPKLAAFDAFDRYEPTWGCEAIERVPSMGGDGPKWLCGAEVTRNHALVYSFGSNGDTQFEEGVRDLLPSSEIFIFDPTMSTDGVAEVKRRGFNLIESGLVPRGDTSFVHAKQSMAGRDLMQHMRALGYAGRTIDILKMDIDAMEYASLNSIKIGECTDGDVRVGQLLIEMHAYPNKIEFVREKIVALMAQLSNCNLRMFSKERNHWGCAGFKCVEFSFVGPSHAFNVYQNSRPACTNWP